MSQIPDLTLRKILSKFSFVSLLGMPSISQKLRERSRGHLNYF